MTVLFRIMEVPTEMNVCHKRKAASCTDAVHSSEKSSREQLDISGRTGTEILEKDVGGGKRP